MSDSGHPTVVYLVGSFHKEVDRVDNLRTLICTKKMPSSPILGNVHHIFKEALKGLGYLHHNLVYHGDIKGLSLSLSLSFSLFLFPSPPLPLPHTQYRDNVHTNVTTAISQLVYKQVLTSSLARDPVAAV